MRSLGANEVIDYKKRKFDDVPRDDEVVLGTVQGDTLKVSFDF